MRISDWSSDVCSSDLVRPNDRADGQGARCDQHLRAVQLRLHIRRCRLGSAGAGEHAARHERCSDRYDQRSRQQCNLLSINDEIRLLTTSLCVSGVQYYAKWLKYRSPTTHSPANARSEEHTSEHKSLMRISYAVS